jgi:hypothetical protein
MAAVTAALSHVYVAVTSHVAHQAARTRYFAIQRTLGQFLVYYLQGNTDLVRACGKLA